jgi:hypothetical protein
MNGKSTRAAGYPILDYCRAQKRKAGILVPLFSCVLAVISAGALPFLARCRGSIMEIFVAPFVMCGSLVAVVLGVIGYRSRFRLLAIIASLLGGAALAWSVAAFLFTPVRKDF